MERGKRRPQSARLMKMCEAVAVWRASRESERSRVPEELWSQAVEVAHVDGLWTTARALRFNYAALKRRFTTVRKSRARSASSVLGATEFVEVPALAITTGRADTRMVVELLSPRNDRMRIEADPRALDVAALVRAFWSRES